MALSRQALLSTVGLIKCPELGVRDISIPGFSDVCPVGLFVEV